MLTRRLVALAVLITAIHHFPIAFPFLLAGTAQVGPVAGHSEAGILGLARALWVPVSAELNVSVCRSVRLAALLGSCLAPGSFLPACSSVV